MAAVHMLVAVRKLAAVHNLVDHNHPAKTAYIKQGKYFCNTTTLCLKINSILFMLVMTLSNFIRFC